MSGRKGPIGFSDEQAALLESAARFCAEKSPIASVRGLIRDEVGFDPAVFAEIGELGWLGVAIPEAYGGSGLEIAEVVPLVEQMGRRLLATPFVSTTLAAQAILAAGSEEQKQRVLPAIAAGAAATIALAEPHGDFDPRVIECRAIHSGEEIELAGAKVLVLDAAAAGWAVVSVNLEGRPALVLLDADALAATRPVREAVMDETRRAFRISLDGVKVPASALLAGGDAAAAIARVELAGALLTAAEMCGAGFSCVDYTVEYLTTRKQFGRLIGSYQALKHPTVEAHLGMEQARSHLYAAAHTFEHDGAGEIAVRMAKAQVGPALGFAADRAIQFHGGFGFTYECDAQLYRRHAIFGETRFGDARYHRERLADLVL